MGKKFALPITSKNFKPIPLIADMEQWVQTIKDDTEKEINRAKIANRISNYKRNIYNNDKEKFILAMFEDTKNFIREIEEKIIITSADKGNKTVVMYKEQYRYKLNNLLDDKTTYKPIREDPTEKLQRMNNNLVNDLHKNKLISKWEKSKLTSISASAPDLYGLPKIHKENTPLRPIAASTNVPCYNLAQYVGKLLRTIISPTYNIKNCMDLKDKLNDIKLDKDDIMVSFDVVSLFTNIPIHLAIKNILDKWKFLQEKTQIPKQTFLKILNFVLKDNNYFKCNDKVYHQTYGMPMGNPLSPTIADIVLDTLLDDVIEELKAKDIQIKLLTKYVDDVFAIINKHDETNILTLLNKYHNKIQFTIEKEVNNKLPYLDVLIIRNDNKLQTEWYTKDTSSGRIINYHSTQPRSMKVNTARSLLKKIKYITDEQYLRKNIKKYTGILKKNSYPQRLIDDIIYEYNNKKQDTPKSDTQTINFISVPYIPNLTETKNLRNIIRDTTTTLAHRSNSTLQTIFKRTKQKADKQKENNVVYEVICEGSKTEKCGKVYVGTTKRMLGVRMKEHQNDINKGTEKTALSQHIKETGHTADFKNVRILDKAKNENKRYTLESLRIQQRIDRSINTKEDKDNTKLQYSIAIT
ncbi:uncharacterized protein LOC133324293 [Musca vetustissima]|uniref:uncharacterized protein LOC133324293 n=1 Tax=Musca vetustissima TaxID=27455 RepID=UPI002AB708D5|nr:uncharacterized protein LOC133324293 [Musca vetustissima]